MSSIDYLYIQDLIVNYDFDSDDLLETAINDIIHQDYKESSTFFTSDICKSISKKCIKHLKNVKCVKNLEYLLHIIIDAELDKFSLSYISPLPECLDILENVSKGTITKAFMHLDPYQIELIHLKYFYKLSIKEISMLLKKSENYIHKKLFHSVLQLETYIKTI